jgi:imidazolonepropionase-like amidohydrolase
MSSESLCDPVIRIASLTCTGKLRQNSLEISACDLHLELALLHRIGLSPRETIAAATSNFADIYGWRDVGRIEPGRVADVLILDSDPRSDLEALNHIDMMVFRGAVPQSTALARST